MGSSTREKNPRCKLLALAFAALFAASCGNSAMGPELSMEPAWPEHGWEQGVREGAYVVVAVDAHERGIEPLTTSLRLVVEPSGAGERVVIRGSGLAGLDHAYLHLKYDEAAVHPILTRSGEELLDAALFIGITEMPGVVALGLATIGGEPRIAGDVVLAEVEFAPGPFLGARRVSAVNDSVVSDLHFSAENTALLGWSYTAAGDYDQNSEVNIADLTPIGIHYKKTTDSLDWQAAQVADGDDNGEINIADITTIGQNYLERLTDYAIEGGPEESGPFANTGSISQSAGILPPDGGYRQIEYELATPVEGAWYVVVAKDGAEEAAGISNAAQYSATIQLKPPRNLQASSNGENIELTWRIPSGVEPLGYDAYRSDQPDMQAAFLLNPEGLISGTSLEAPGFVSKDDPHYFGVKAVYSTGESNYSNIYFYTPGGDAPANLTAMRSGDHVDLDWDAPSSATPDGYNAYRADNMEMTGAFKVNTLGPITGTAFSVDPLFSPDQEHYFGVKAIYGGGESAYSNIFFYTPSAEGDAPVWTDGLPDGGIKSATPGDSQVTIEWYEATDAESPPVTYLIFYAESAAGIDWGVEQRTAGEGTAMMVIDGLANGMSYDFGVRARDAVGNATTNTNFLRATPVAGGVPFDSGVWQPSELVDDGGQLPSQDVGWLSDVEILEDGTIGIVHYNHSGQDLMYSYNNMFTDGPWISETITSQGDTGLWPDLEFHPVSGYPCIAYHNASDASLEYAAYNGSGWDIEVVDSGGDVGAFASLEFDPSDNRPAIAYWDAIGLDVKYAKHNGSGWTKAVAYNGFAEGGDGLNATGMHTSLAFNPATNRPGIAFMKTYIQTSFPMLAAWITQFTGSGWEAEEADLGSAGEIGIGSAGWSTSLCYSGTGVPYIIHVDILNDVRLADKSAGFWQASVVGSTSYLLGQEFIETDMEWYDDSPYWVYYDSGGGGSVYFGVGFSQGEQIESGGKGGQPSLDIMGDGTVHASYLDVVNNELRYASRSSDETWSAELAAAGEGGESSVGERASLAYNPAVGSPMISYYDSSASALKYADKPLGAWQIEVVSNSGNDGSASAMGVDSDGKAYIGFFTITDQLAGLKVASGGFGNWEITTITEANFETGGDVAGNYCSLGMAQPPDEVAGLAFHNTTRRRMEFALGNTGGSYEITTVDIFNDPGRWSAVAFNPANKFPAVAYFARDTADLYFVEREGNGDWNPVPVDSVQMVGNRCSMVYGTNTAKPWISYYDETNQRLKVAYLDGAEWKTMIVPAPGGSASYGSFSSIAWHPVHQRPAVAFYDADAGKLWYVFIGSPAAPQDAVEVAGAVNVEGVFPSLVFHAATAQPGIAYQDVTNGDLRYVFRTAE